MALLDHPPPLVRPPLDVAAASDDELLDALHALELEQRALDAARLELLGETAARHVTERRTGLRLKAWLLDEHHVAGATAAARVNTAKKLRLVLPEIARALSDGAISMDHAVFVARLCTPRVEPYVVELQERFIELAQLERFDAWSKDVQGIVSLADQDGPGPLGEPRSRLRMVDGLDGALHVDMDLVGADAQRFRAAVLEEAERRYREHCRNHPAHTVIDGCCDDATADHAGFEQFPGRNDLFAEALVALVVRGCGARPNAPSPVTDVTLIVQATGPLDARTPDGVRVQDGTPPRTAL